MVAKNSFFSQSELSPLKDLFVFEMKSKFLLITLLLASLMAISYPSMTSRQEVEESSGRGLLMNAKLKLFKTWQNKLRKQNNEPISN